LRHGGRWGFELVIKRFAFARVGPEGFRQLRCTRQGPPAELDSSSFEEAGPRKCVYSFICLVYLCRRLSEKLKDPQAAALLPAHARPPMLSRELRRSEAEIIIKMTVYTYPKHYLLSLLCLT
jgi:hypothetical protein